MAFNLGGIIGGAAKAVSGIFGGSSGSSSSSSRAPAPAPATTPGGTTVINTPDTTGLASLQMLSFMNAGSAASIAASVDRVREAQSQDALRDQAQTIILAGLGILALVLIIRKV